MSITVKRIKQVEEVLPVWPFFLEGLAELNRLTGEDRQIDATTFFRVVIDAIGVAKEKAHVALYYLDSAELIGFSITIPENSPYHKPTAIVYAAYSKKTVPGGSRYAMQHIEKWAKAQGYAELQAFSPRINGKAFALFEKRFGFRRWLVSFTKSL